MEENELDLLDLWRMLLARRWLALGIILGSMTVALAYLVLATPIYEARFSVRVGSVAGTGDTSLPGPKKTTIRVDGVLEEPVSLGEELKSTHVRNAHSLAWVSDAAPDRQDPLLVNVKIQCHVGSECVALGQQVLDALTARHQHLFAEMERDIQDRLVGLETTRDRAYSALQVVERMLRQSEGRDAGALSASVSLTHDIIIIDERAAELKANLRKNSATSVVEGLKEPVAPISPRKELVVFLALAGGIVFTVVLVVWTSPRARD